MPRSFPTPLLGTLALCGAITLAFAAAPNPVEDGQAQGNAYYIYTQALRIDESGVGQIPARFQWSVETSWRGIDLQGQDLPDARLMLRLYDPDHNFTALTAQIDLATAAKLHRELGELIAKKQQNPAFQHRPQLYDPQDIPTRQLIGVDKQGTAIVEDVNKPAQETQRPK